MRAALIAALITVFGLTAIPPQGLAAPAVPTAPGMVTAAAPEFMMVADGCGRGWHRQRWRDRYGRWHTRCVRNGY